VYDIHSIYFMLQFGHISYESIDSSFREC